MADLLGRVIELDDRGDHDGALAALREAFARFNAGHRGILFEVLAEDLDWKVPEIFPDQSREPGREGFQRFIAEQFDLFDEWSVEPEDYVRNGNRVAVLVRQRARGRASGAEVEIRVAQLWTVGDDGRIVAFEGVANHDDARRIVTSQ